MGVTTTAIQHARAVDLREYVLALGYRPTRRGRSGWLFFSPFREEQHPSFSVFPHAGIYLWKDWGTGESGDIIRFVEKYYEESFREAVHRLVGTTTPPECIRSIPARPHRTALRGNRPKSSRRHWILDQYPQRVQAMTEEERTHIGQYFHDRSVPYYPEMGGILHRGYLALPVPFPEKVRGLECRALEGEGRKTLGRKMLWLLQRDCSRVLVTESILDALAGEVVLGDREMTLCALNGVGNIAQLRRLVVRYRPRRVLLALDNDPAGHAALDKGKQLLASLTIMQVIDDHIRAGVKDLHKLLVRMKHEYHERKV
jgi:hypothetical protein